MANSISITHPMTGSMFYSGQQQMCGSFSYTIVDKKAAAISIRIYVVRGTEYYNMYNATIDGSSWRSSPFLPTGHTGYSVTACLFADNQLIAATTVENVTAPDPGTSLPEDPIIIEDPCASLTVSYANSRDIVCRCAKISILFYLLFKTDIKKEMRVITKEKLTVETEVIAIGELYIVNDISYNEYRRDKKVVYHINKLDERDDILLVRQMKGNKLSHFTTRIRK